MKSLLENAKQIVCILPKGKVSDVQEGLMDKFDILNANFHHARGVGRFSALSAVGLGEQQEKDILEVTVSSDQADEILEYIFFRADMNHPHGGVAYVTGVPKMSVFEIPDLPKENSV